MRGCALAFVALIVGMIIVGAAGLPWWVIPLALMLGVFLFFAVVVPIALFVYVIRALL